VREIVDLCSRLKPPPETQLAINDLTQMRCACGKWKPVTEMTLRYSGVVPYMDNVCRGCPIGKDAMAKLVCSGCKTLVARLTPHKDKSGFRYIGDHCYHIDECAICKDKKAAAGDEGALARPSIIIEKVIFLRDKVKGGYKPY
jgi:hypothetical protein